MPRRLALHLVSHRYTTMVEALVAALRTSRQATGWPRCCSAKQPTASPDAWLARQGPVACTRRLARPPEWTTPLSRCYACEELTSPGMALAPSPTHLTAGRTFRRWRLCRRR